MISNLLSKKKDGGPESTVEAYFLIEIKSLFSVALLKFNFGSRRAYHSHAFDAWTWFLCGNMREELVSGFSKPYKRSLLPKVTLKSNMHKVHSYGTSWCFTVRGPWSKDWKEYDSRTDIETTLVSGREVTGTKKGLTV